MKISVTGGTGFIGNYVIKALLDRDIEVIVTGTDLQKAMQYAWFEKVTFVELDINTMQTEEVLKKIASSHKLIHLAWRGLHDYKETIHIEENLPNHSAFLKTLLQHGLNDITVTGTCLEYGMREGCLTENMKCEPANPYAVAKNELRKTLAQMATQKGVHFKWARLFYMYGKGQSSKSLISQLNKALEAHESIFNMSGGEQVRDFLPVEKVAEYIVLIALQNKVNGIINCCSGKPVMVKQFVLDYLEQQGKTIKLNLGYYPYTDYEPMRFWGDDGKLKSIIL